MRRRRIPTIADVAKAAGVSTSTVSYVMNDRNRVGPETRRRVLRAIEELGYRPNSAARGLASRHVGSIGLVIPHSPDDVFADPFFPELLRGIGRSANRNHHTLVLSMAKETDLYDEGISLLRTQRADGLLVIDPGAGIARLPKLAQEGFPVVVIGRQEHPDLLYVDVDNEHGCYTAARHIMGCGDRTRIGIISGPKEQQAAKDRLAGYRKGLLESGVSWEDVAIAYGDFTEKSGYECMRTLLNSAAPRAVLVANDLMAIGAYQAIAEAGLHVPRDVSLIGFDDIVMVRFLNPPLTTVRQPTAELGETAADMLVAWLKGNRPLSRVLPVQLVVRESCGVPTKGGE